MRILILSHMYPNQGNPISGIFVHQQAKALVDLGHDVKVISPIPWAPHWMGLFGKRFKKYTEIPFQNRVDNIEVYFPRYMVLPKHLFFEYSGDCYYHAIKNLVEQLYKIWAFDIIHAHVALPDGYAGAKFKRLFNKPLVITVHGQDVNYTMKRSTVSKAKIVETLEAADAVITVSGMLKKSLSELVEHSKIEVIYNGIDVNAEPQITNPIKDKYKDKKIIVSVGNLLESKGQGIVIKAIKKVLERHKNIVYIIVGKGPYKNELEQLVHQLNLEPYIEFTGQLPHDEAMKYTQACDIFALPSYPEGFGIAFAEAMAYAKPVIACRKTGIEDILIDGQNGLLVPFADVDAVAEAVNRLLDDRDYALSIGQNAKRSVDGLTWENSAWHLMQVYERVAKHEI